MTWQYSPYSIFLFLTAMGQIFLALFARQQQRNRTTDTFTFLLLCTSWWAICYGLEIASIGLAAKVFWSQAATTGIAFLVVFWLLLVLAYVGRLEWVTRWRLLAVSLMPALTVTLVWTNRHHHLFWVKNQLSADGLFLVNSPGPWYWAFVATAYLYVAASATGLLLTLWRSVSDTFRWQAAAMLVTLLVPWAANAISLAGLGPDEYLDLTPFAFAFSSIFLYLGLKRLYLLDITPLAQSDVINSLEDGVIVIDRLGRILNLNQGAIRILPTGSQRLIGHPLPDELAAQLELPPSLSGKAPYTTEVSFPQAGGDRYYQLRLYLFEDRDRSQRGYLILLNDISESKQLQHMREELSHALVHDLRSPISNLALTLEWLASLISDELSEEEWELVRAAQHTADKLLLLVSSILDLERLETGVMPLNWTRVCLPELVEQALRDQALAAQVRGQTLDMSMPASLPEVSADQEMIYRVLQNLLGNSIKFTPRGGHILVSATEVDGKVQVCVEDNGPGISTDVAKHLFEKFRPGYEDGHGSGLGLAFCKLALEAHDETIWVDSQAEKGTRFIFSLPTLAPEHVDMPRESMTVSPMRES